MSNAPLPLLPLGATRPAADYEKTMHHAAAKAPPHFKLPEIKGMMGAGPMATVEAVELLATIPENLGPNVDTTA